MSAAEIYEQAREEERAGNLAKALQLYRASADRRHGLAAKRMWELLKDRPGAEDEAALYHEIAVQQKSLKSPRRRVGIPAW